MKKDSLKSILLAGCIVMIACEPKPSQPIVNESQPGGIDRTSLPIKEPARPAYKELDVRNATPPARFEVKTPEGAPNVIVVLIDDMGFGVSDTYGGPVPMPTIEKLAQNGLRYNRFHTTAVCSPTRVALLTGYNHHSNNAGSTDTTCK